MIMITQCQHGGDDDLHAVEPGLAVGHLEYLDFLEGDCPLVVAGLGPVDHATRNVGHSVRAQRTSASSSVRSSPSS